MAKYSQYTHYCNVEITQNDHLEYLTMAFAHPWRAVAEFLRENILEQESRTSPSGLTEERRIIASLLKDFCHDVEISASANARRKVCSTTTDDDAI